VNERVRYHWRDYIPKRGREKGIRNHERSSRTTEKHRETEAMKKRRKQSQAYPQLPRRRSIRCHHKVSQTALVPS
jgi:hypothetical protein